MRLIRSATQKRTETSSVDELREVNVASPLAGRCHDSLLILIAPPALAPPATVHALRTSPANRCAPDSHLRKSPTGPTRTRCARTITPNFHPIRPLCERHKGAKQQPVATTRKRRVTRAHLNADSILSPDKKRTNAPIKRNQKEGHRNRRHRSIHRRPT